MPLIRFPQLSSIHFICTLLLVPAFWLSTSQAVAIENESTNQAGISLQKIYENGVYGNLFVSSFYQNGFNNNAVNYLNFSLGKNVGNSSYAFSFYTTVPRGNAEREIRLIQQYSYRVFFAGGVSSFTVNLDERYFNQSNEMGLRSRFRLQWVKPVDERHSLQLGWQTHFAWNDVEQKDLMQRGFRQTRLIFGVNRELRNGNRINVNYQARFQNRAFSENVLQHHVQFLYSHRL